MNYSRLKVLPKPQGPFPTGSMDLMFGRTKQGTLMRLFYPSSQGTTKEKPLTSWFLGSEYTRGLASFVGTATPYIFETLFNWSTKEAMIPSAWEAPVADGRFPVVLFSHGLGAHRTFYSTVCNNLASHGFVVAAIEHRDESASATFTLTEENETIWLPYRRLKKGVKEHPLRSSQVRIRAAEVSRALDLLQKLDMGEVETNDLPALLPLTDFRGKLDSTRPLIVGHSFGAATAILAMAKDSRFVAGVGLDPWMFPLKEELRDLARDVKQPLLVVLTEAFQNQVNFKSFQPFDIERNYFVTLKGSVHQNQADTPFLFGFLGRVLSGCWSTLDKDLAMDLNNRLVVNFICKQLGMTYFAPGMTVGLAQPHLQVGLHLQQASLDLTQRLLFSRHSTRGAEVGCHSRREVPAKL